MDLKLIKEKVIKCEKYIAMHGGQDSYCKHRTVRLVAAAGALYGFKNKAGHICEQNDYCLKDKLGDKTVCPAVHAEEAFVHFCMKNSLQKEELPTVILCDYTPCNKCYRLLHDLYVDKGAVLTYVYRNEYRENHNLWKGGSAVIEFVQYDDLFRVSEKFEIEELIRTRIEKLVGFRHPFKNYEIDFSVKHEIRLVSTYACTVPPAMLNLEYEYFRLLRSYVFKELEPKWEYSPFTNNPAWVLVYDKEDLIKFLIGGD